MRYLIQHVRRATAARRALVVAVLTLTLVPACNRDDPLPTGPPTTAPATPAAAILGATVTGIPFDVVAINESGQVAGTSMSGGAPRAMLWTPGGATQDLGTLGGTSSWAYAINESGQVAGASLTAAGDRHAFLWTPGQGMQDLGTLGGALSSTARGINDGGQVVGESKFPRVGAPEAQTHAFLWSLGQGMQDLGALGQGLTSSVAYDINNAGQVVGRSFAAQYIPPPIDPEYYSRAFLWAPGQGMQALGALSGGFSIAYAINDAGTVVGRSWVSRPFSVSYHAFRWTSGDGMRDLGGFGGSDSSDARGINEAGQIVGTSTIGAGPFNSGRHAFIWSTSEGLESITPTTGISRALAINDRQQVVGDGRVATLHLAPGNVPPVAKVGGPYAGSEGSEVPFDMSGTDLDGGDLWGQVDYGDGARDYFDVMLPHLSPERNAKHIYADNGTYTLTLIVSDARGGRDTTTTTVAVANVAPTILAGSLTGPATPILLTGGNASAPIAFEFRDPASINDVYAAEIACGNGVVLRPTNIPVSNTVMNGVYVGKGTYAGTCPYTSAGVYTVRVTVSDEDGGTSAPADFRYVIVYDPTGASVTGSGFYAVPGQAKRKAHFTFDAQYVPGQPLPNGNVRFWVPGGQVDFESTAIELLVASEGRAQFWGTGTLNGTAVRFRITAVDGSGASDAVRIELWNAAGTSLLYDTQPGAAQDAPLTTTIDGGNIRIRRA